MTKEQLVEAMQKNCACLRSDNSAVIDKLQADIEALEMKIGKMKCCENCQTVVDAEGNCYQKKDGLCINYSRWELRNLQLGNQIKEMELHGEEESGNAR